MSMSNTTIYDTRLQAHVVLEAETPLYNRKNEMCRVGKRNAMVLVENEM